MIESIITVNLSAIDLNLFLVLREVLATRSVAKAAARLHVTPPAVSNALARLRQLVGDPLFVRDGRGITPTPRALELEPIVETAVGMLSRSLEQGVSFDPRTTERELTLALSDGDQVANLPAIVRVFARRMPRARLRIVSIDALVAAGGLAAPLVDAAIGPHYESEGVRNEWLYDEEGVLVARDGHPRLRRTINAAQFNAERHVDIHLSLGRAGVGNRAVADAFAAAGLVRDVAVVVPSFAAAAAVISATDLVGGLPRRTALALRGAFGTRVLGGPLPRMVFRMQLQWHERTHRDPAAAALRAVIVEAVGASGRGR